jgi:hypothetical protein
MKSVTSFLSDHKTSDEVIILGQCPSSKTEPFKNGTFARLDSWCKQVGLDAWDFHNVIHDKINSYDLKDVDDETLIQKTQGKRVVIALGNFVSRACKKNAIYHYKIDHPSPRNRNLNSKEYEEKMIASLKEFLIQNKIIEKSI